MWLALVAAVVAANVAPDVASCLDVVTGDVDSVDRGIACLDAIDRPGADVDEAKKVLVRLRAHAPPPAETVDPLPDQARQFVVDGRLDAGINGAAFGAFAAFAATGGVLAANRTSEADALPWLLAAPAAGAVVGASVGVASVAVTGLSVDDLAFITSTTWAATALGFTLQSAVFADSRDVQAAPLRLFTTLSCGALGLAAGIGWSPFLDVEAGDAALANSAFIWSGALTSAVLVSLNASGVPVDLPTSLAIAAGGAVLGWGGVMAAHPWLHFSRASTWIIDAFGGLGVVGGLVVGGAVGFVFSSGVAFGIVFAGGFLTSLAAGVVTAAVVDNLGAAPHPTMHAWAPTVFRARDGLAPGIVVEVARW